MSLKSGLIEFYAELRKRRVLKATVAYIVTAWILIEGAAVIFPALLLPDWTHRFVVVLGIIGFPIVVVLAWIFDLTPKGVERTSLVEEEPDSDTGAVTKQLQQAPSHAPPAVDAALASIAVLPFNAYSSDPNDQFLAQGISAEIATALAHLPEVRVAPSRSTSAMDDATDLQKIGETLSVQYVLTGSVRRRGPMLRVLAELSDVAKCNVVWSEAYDRQPDELITVEEEIAAAIVGSFGGEQLREQIRSAHDHATSSTEARVLVHRARAYILNYNKQSLDEAEQFARKAIELDPGYASAQAALASVLSEKVSSGLAEDADKDITEALSAIDAAVSLRPQDPFVLKLAGNVWSYAGQHAKALAILRRAIEVTPFDFGAWGYLAFVLATSGKAEDRQEAQSILDRIIATAPQHPGVAYWMHHKAVAYTGERQYEDAARLAKQALDRQPGLAWAWYLLANAAAMTGDNESAENAAARASSANPELSVTEYAAIVDRTSASEEICESRLAGLKDLGLLRAD